MNSFLSQPLRVPITQAKYVPICVNCKYYMPPDIYGINIQDKKKGFCQKSGTMHIVDGTIKYELVEFYREHICKGSEFEESTTKVVFEPLDPISTQ